METTEIGKSVRRLDYETKVTGRALYLADMQVPGMCHGKILRSPLPHARIMIHQPLGGVQGQATDIEIQAKEILRYRKLLDELLSRHTGQPLDKIAKDTDRDFIMTSEQAKDYGIIDEVISTRKISKELAAAAAGSS